MKVVSYDHLQDLTALHHPMTKLRTRSALMQMQAGEILKVIVNNPDSAHEIQSIFQQAHHYVLKCIESKTNKFSGLKRKGRSRSLKAGKATHKCIFKTCYI